MRNPEQLIIFIQTITPTETPEAWRPRENVVTSCFSERVRLARLVLERSDSEMVSSELHKTTFVFSVITRCELGVANLLLLNFTANSVAMLIKNCF